LKLRRYTRVAAFLVYTIWKINPGPDGVREPLLPLKGLAVQ